MGIDFIRNTRLDIKKKTLKFEIADGNIRPITYYPVKIDDSEGKFQKEIENFVRNIFSGQYHVSGNSDSAVNVKYAKIKVDNLLSDYFEKGKYYDPENFIDSFYNLTDEKSKEFFKEKAVPLFIECMTEKDRDGYACIIVHWIQAISLLNMAFYFKHFLTNNIIYAIINI